MVFNEREKLYENNDKSMCNFLTTNTGSMSFKQQKVCMVLSKSPGIEALHF